MIKRLKRPEYIFLLIIFLGAVLRFVGLGSNPPSPNWDEVSHGYNAYSILQTGEDEWGVSFPSIFRAYGDYKLPVYIYLTSLSVKLFGLTALAVRLISALAGVGTIIFSYLLAKRLFAKNSLVPILASLLVAIEPWSFFLSRGAFEANLALFFIVSGVYLFLNALKKPKLLVLSSILLGLSVWTYNSARIFTPLLATSLIVIYFKELKTIFKKSRKIFNYSVVILALFFLPMFWQLANPVGQARYNWVSLINEGAVAQIEEARNTSDLPETANRLVNNRVVYFGTTFSKNWLSHFSGDFLFLKGGSHHQFSVPNHGLLYIIGLPFLILGIVVLAKKKDKGSSLILIWLFLGPVASSLTSEAPHVLRSIVILPMPMLITAVGLNRAGVWASRNIKAISTFVFAAYFLLLGLLVKNYLKEYFVDYKKDYSWSWQYGYKDVVSYLRQNYGKYDKIVVSKKYGEPHEFILFHWPWNPEFYRNDSSLNRFFQTDWFWVDSFDKFFFINDWQVVEEELGNYTFAQESGGLVQCTPRMFDCLLVTSPENAPEGWTKLETINFLDGSTAFEIYEN